MRELKIPDKTIRKKFNNTSAKGLGIAKNGKLQYPFKFQSNLPFSDTYNKYGQIRPKVGDYCAYALPSGILTASTVARILEEHPNSSSHDGHYVVEFLDGRIEDAWRYATGFLDKEQLQEVCSFYESDSATQKYPITVDWIPL